MALFSCPECEGKVSDQAVSCPHCGFPMQGQVHEEPATPVHQPPHIATEPLPPPPDDEPGAFSADNQQQEEAFVAEDVAVNDVVQATVANVKESWNPKLNTKSIPAHYTALGCSGIGLFLILFLLVTMIAAGFDKAWFYLVLTVLLGWLALVFFQVFSDLQKIKERNDKP